MPTEQNADIYCKVSELCASLWEASESVVASNQDPKIHSVMLFKRLSSHHHGFTLLYHQNLSLDASIILRSGLEVAICIAANFHLRDEFVDLLRLDAVFSLKAQIKLYREEGFTELVQQSELRLRELNSKLPEKSKAARLNWKDLAEKGKVPQLYQQYRQLSGISTHVTGLSLLRGVVAENGEGLDTQHKLSQLDKKWHPMIMTGATLLASKSHAEMIDNEAHMILANQLIEELNATSLSWGEN